MGMNMVYKIFKGDEADIKDRLGKRIMVNKEAWWPGEFMQQQEAIDRGISEYQRNQINAFLEA